MAAIAPVRASRRRLRQLLSMTEGFDRILKKTVILRSGPVGRVSKDALR
jgi:hypothetical protein